MRRDQKPKIGVMPLYESDKEACKMLDVYMAAVIRAGGVPFVFPLTCDETVLNPLLEIADGLLFTGGQDVEPERYGEKRQPWCGETLSRRDDMETILFQRGLELKKPMFSTCRGFQLFNTLNGGTLYQGLPEEHPSDIGHNQKSPYDQPVHSAKVVPDTPLAKITEKDVLEVNSFHHQAVHDLSDRFRPMAISPDGLIEAIYMPDQVFVMGVQWHPEWMIENDESSRRLFCAFIESCI